jgi:hypothetical protein
VAVAVLRFSGSSDGASFEPKTGTWLLPYLDPILKDDKRARRRRSSMKPLVLFWCIACLCTAREKTLITVHVISHDSRVNERTSTYETPGKSNAICSGSATTMGNTTVGTSNCQATSTPARTHRITHRTMDVLNMVEAGGFHYTISCTASWAGSNCQALIDGQSFPAEIDRTTMWLSGRSGGNQGKLIRVKYKILDIRQAPQN